MSTTHHSPPVHPQLGTPREVYEYLNADSEVVFVVCRFEPKTFRQARPDGDGWEWTLDGIAEPPLYQLPRILDALWIGERIWIAEGEKDVAALEQLGLYATCNPMGAGKWRPWHSETLASAAKVTIVADRDEPGLAHALAVRDSLRDVGVRVIDVVYPGAGKDASDHFAALLADYDFVPVDLDEPTVVDDGWTPLNLAEIGDEPPVKPTLGGVGLVYPGKRHIFSGPPESAKTLAAYLVGLYVVRGGETVVLVDFEMGAYEARARLLELGATGEDLAGIRYIAPAEPASDTRIAGLVELHPALVIIDAAVGAFDLQGLDDNKRADVEKLTRLYVGPFWRRGIASIFIDHVAKNTETRGHYAIGSERKLGGADVHIGFEVITPISRGTSGRYKIVTHKDRGGYLKRGHLLDLVLNSDPETHLISGDFIVPSVEISDAPERYFRPTRLMEKVSVYLELQPEPVSRRIVEDGVVGKRDYIRDAIEVLIREGFAAVSDGPRGSKMLSIVTAYRESDDLAPPRPDLAPGEDDSPDSDLAPPRPDLAPGEDIDLAPIPPLQGGGFPGRRVEPSGEVDRAPESAWLSYLDSVIDEDEE